MSAAVNYVENKASEAEIAEHLLRCDADFVPPLSKRLEINDYAKKIFAHATRFEAWSDNKLLGLVAAYYNDQKNRVAFITSVSVLREWAGKGIAAHLMNQCIEHAKKMGMLQIRLEVASNNRVAIKLYEKTGFELCESKESFFTMTQYLTSGEKHG